jgi:hypothetical protein
MDNYEYIFEGIIMNMVVSKILRTDALKIIKLTIRPISRYQPRCSSFPHVYTDPTVSFIFGTLPGSLFLLVSSTLQFGLDLSGIKQVSFQLQFHFWKYEEFTVCKIRGVQWVGMTNISYFSRNCWMRMEVWDGVLSWWSWDTVHDPLPSPTSAVSWMFWFQSWQMRSWICATVSGVVQLLVLLPMCSSSPTDVWSVLNLACQWNTFLWLKIWSPKACWIIVRISVALFPRLAQNLMHSLFLSLIHCENCSCLPSYVQLGTLTH